MPELSAIVLSIVSAGMLTMLATLPPLLFCIMQNTGLSCASAQTVTPATVASLEKAASCVHVHIKNWRAATYKHGALVLKEEGGKTDLLRFREGGGGCWVRSTQYVALLGSLTKCTPTPY